VRTFNESDWIVDLKGYAKVRTLNRGSVQLLRDLGTNKEIVVKEVPLDPYSNSPVSPDVQFRRELETLITLVHPCILLMRGWVAAGPETAPMFVFDYCRPPTLKTLLHHPLEYKWWTSTAKAKVLVGIVQGMSFIHSRNLVHRELKTRAILLDKTHDVKIGGFGRSKFDDLDLTKQTMYNSRISLYEAPEMWTDDYTNAVDVYAFAMILFRVITGGSPFPEMKGKSPSARMQRVANGGRPEIGGDVVPFVRALLESCWAHDPSQRPPFVKIMDILNQYEFKIFKDVDSAVVRRYIDEIRLKEQHT
jgi:serine/threonine protein kinase